MKSSFLAAFALVCGIAFAAPQTARADSACSFQVGVVPQFEQRRIHEVWGAILDRLSKKTGCSFAVAGSSTILEFEKSFQQGAYDFAYMNPYHAVMAHRTQGYEPIVRSDAKKLRGILVVRRESLVQRVEDLAGQDVAFPSPNALGASLLMRAELARDYNTPVKPRYVKTHSSVYLHVAKGLTVAGGGVARTLESQPAHIRDALRVLHTTKPVYAHPLVVHPRVSDEHKIAVQQAWLELAAQDGSLFEGVPMKAPVATSYADYKALEEFGLEDFVGNKE